ILQYLYDELGCTKSCTRVETCHFCIKKARDGARAKRYDSIIVLQQYSGNTCHPQKKTLCD
ncbi:hypothetical protein DPZ52_18010, partial [Salmonella enterica subsp. enterica serovar Bovismorbificans]|nr:hypothetical protein [Salmonella enterica]EBS4195117.1 hypothetical protein [Salmonella enterica subsp. enterica serovar Bovismorbificans]